MFYKVFEELSRIRSYCFGSDNLRPHPPPTTRTYTYRSVRSAPPLLPPRAAACLRYVEQLETLKSQEKSIVRNTQVVEQMYALLAQYDVKAPSEDMVQVDDLRTIQVHCTTFDASSRSNL